MMCFVPGRIVALHNHENPWLSRVDFLIAVGSLGLMICQQQHTLPPMKNFE